MMKNEENIVESFIRHAMRFSDYVVVFNHNSTDGTQDILEALVKEYGDKIIIYPEVMDTAMTINREMFNHMIGYAFHELEADMVLPLDSDEFPVLLTEGDIRAYLEKLSQEQCYKVHFIPFSPTKEWKKDVFAPMLFQRRKKISKDTDYKVFLTRKLYLEQGLEVGLGNHLAYSSVSGQEIEVRDLYPELFYVLLPFRNREHLESKLVIRWLSLIMRQDVTSGTAFQYQDGYTKILHGQELSQEQIDWFSMNNMCAGSEHRENVEDIQKEVEEVEIGCLFENLELKYTHLVQAKSNYVLLMEFAQQVIEQYKDEKGKCEQFSLEKEQLFQEKEKLIQEKGMLCKESVEKEVQLNEIRNQLQNTQQINIHLEQQYRQLENHYLQMKHKYEMAEQNLAQIKGSKAWKMIQLYRKFIGKHDPSQD